MHLVEHIAEAVTQMRDALLDGNTPERAVQQVASGYKMTATLLSRKFKEQHGCGPEEWIRQSALRSAYLVAIQDAKIEERRRALCESWRNVVGVNNHLGEPFTLSESTYWFCAENDCGDIFVFNATSDNPIKLASQTEQARQALLNGLAERSALRKSSVQR